MKKVRDIKKGEFIRLKDNDKSPVWVKGEYVRELKKYSLTKFDDVNAEKLVSGDKIVYVGFTF